MLILKDKEKKMVPSKKRVAIIEVKFCDKCGGQMVRRLFPTNHSKTKKFTRIMQCVTCKHWFSLEK